MIDLRIPHPFTWPIVHQIRRILHKMKYAKLQKSLKWFAGDDCHFWIGPFETRENAIEAGLFWSGKDYADFEIGQGFYDPKIEITNIKCVGSRETIKIDGGFDERDLDDGDMIEIGECA